MKTKTLKSISVVALAIFLFSSAGYCGENLVKSGKVSLEVEPSEGLYISKAHVYEKKGKVIVGGQVKLKGIRSTSGKAHVDIAIEKNGETVYSASKQYTPNMLGRTKGRKVGRFHVEVPEYQNINGSTVRVAVHKEVPVSTFKCGLNQAL